MEPGEQSRSRVASLLLKDSVVLLACKTASKALTLVFILIAARQLSQASFGDFQFALALGNMVMQPMLLVTLVVARSASALVVGRTGGSARGFYSRRLGVAAAGAAAAAIAFAVVDPWLSSAARVEARGTVAIVGVSAAAYLLYSYHLGFLQAIEAFRAIGLSYVAIGTVTAAAGALALRWSDDVRPLLASQTLGLVLALGATAAVIRRRLPAATGASHGARQPQPGPDWAFSASIVLFFVLLNMDLVAVKVFFDRIEGGYYARLELCGKIAFLLASSLGMVLLPRATKAFSTGGDPTPQLWRGTLWYAGAMLVCTAAIAAFAGEALPALFGIDFAVDRALVTTLLLAKFAQSYVFVLISFAGAVADRRMVAVVVGIVLVQAALMLLHDGSLIRIGLAGLLPSLVGSAVLMASILAEARSRIQASSTTVTA